MGWSACLICKCLAQFAVACIIWRDSGAPAFKNSPISHSTVTLSGSVNDSRLKTDHSSIIHKRAVLLLYTPIRVVSPCRYAVQNACFCFLYPMLPPLLLAPISPAISNKARSASMSPVPRLIFLLASASLASQAHRSA